MISCFIKLLIKPADVHFGWAYVIFVLNMCNSLLKPFSPTL